MRGLTAPSGPATTTSAKRRSHTIIEADKERNKMTDEEINNMKYKVCCPCVIMKNALEKQINAKPRFGQKNEKRG